MLVRHFSPFEELETMREQLNRLFLDTPQTKSEERQQAYWRMPVELSETDDAYELRAMLPGLDPDRIDVKVTGRTLTIEGELLPREIAKATHVHLSEVRYGKFRRTLEFGEAIQGDNIQASYQQGILTLNIPKTDEKKAIKIKVST
jgi:HSP20 family protein